MGRNRRQQRLRERRERKPEENAPSASGGSSGGSRGRSGGGSLSGGGTPAWRHTIDSWGGFTVIGAIVLAVVVAGLLVFLNRPGASAGDGDFVAKERTAPVNGNFIGNPDAPVRIIEYGDFQCPHCENFYQNIEPTLMEDYVATGLATFEFRNYAFLGPESQQAAESAMCAADQNRFWDFHDLLFLRQGRENSGVFSDGKLKEYAQTIADNFDDFDYAAWEQCFEADTHQAEVIETNRVATNSGVTSTPTVLVNGQVIPGVQDIGTYRSVIDAAIEAAGDAGGTEDGAAEGSPAATPEATGTAAGG